MVCSLYIINYAGTGCEIRLLEIAVEKPAHLWLVIFITILKIQFSIQGKYTYDIFQQLR